MEGPSSGDVVKELHQDLARKYRLHRQKIETLWRSFDKSQRTQCLKTGFADGVVLKHSLDYSLGNVYKIVPELNLRDITEPQSDFLLDLLKHRATTSLFEQYYKGPEGGLGDHQFIDKMMKTKGLRHQDTFKDCYTFFLDEDDSKYGRSVRLLEEKEESLAAFAPAINAGLLIPQSVGELVLHRQINLLQSLSILIDDILEQGAPQPEQARPRKSQKAATAALDKLSLHTPQPNKSLPLLIASARDQRDSSQEFVSLLSTEPMVLSHAVNVWFFTRPELVPDEKGRRLPVHTDRYISGAFIDAIRNSLQSAAAWKYTVSLLERVDNPALDKAHRSLLLQEISNMCHFEYNRTQGLLKRNLCAVTAAKCFKRISNSYDAAGNARVSQKGSPDQYTRSDPQLHYLLRLCHPDTNALKAVDWMTKLSNLYKAHPLEREKLEDREADALGDLAVIISFIQELSQLVSLPSVSRKTGQLFISRSKYLEAELNGFKDQIDLRDFVVPIDNLLQPDVAKNALNALDEAIVAKSGTHMGFIYQDLVHDALQGLEEEFERAKARFQTVKTSEPSPLLLPSSPPPAAREQLIERRRQREKTRPAQSSFYDLSPHEEKPGEAELPPPKTFNVKKSTADVFATLFDKAKARGSVAWTAFESAMVDLGFSIVPKSGSVYTFVPPKSMEATTSLTVHRPHKASIEGYLVLIYACRLKTKYGWDESSFVVS